MRRVDQFHSGTASGDAVTQQLFFLRDQLRALGYESNIYAQHIAPELARDVIDVGHYVGSADELLFVHHSIGHTAFDQLMGVPTPIVTVFHSITPSRFFQDASLRYFIRLGLQQLRVLAKRSVGGIAVSNHNRHEMLDAGFSSVDVLPVRTDFRVARAARVEEQRSRDWLFVGRVAPNKHQLEVVRAFAAYSRSFNDRAALTFVGDTSMIDYADEVMDEAKRLRVDHKVTLTGKVSDTELWRRYASSGLFVCLSEHEGFGVPLLEAMAAGLPVIARAEAAVPETMGGAGILVDRADAWTVASIAHLLATDAELRDRVRRHQDQRVGRIERFDVRALLTNVLEKCAAGRHSLSVQIQGPFETSYSLAILNRELAIGLDGRDEFDVSIFATEGPGDYIPTERDLSLHAHAARLYAASSTQPYPDIVIRQMYPPRVDDSPGAMTFQYFGWEESRLPREYVHDFNRHLDGIGVMSGFVADVLRDSGVVVPIEVVGVGVHPPAHGSTECIPELNDLRRFRFLHVSAAFPRKGVDLLLNAYFASFTGDDDVSLILKTYPNPHNVLGEDLARLKRNHPNPPDVRWIDRDLEADQVGGLYWLTDSYVHPSRGEGFGLPVAEAMLAEVAVITVAATGLADFVDESTAATISFEVTPAMTHLSVPGSTWVEPDAQSLAKEMRAAFDGTDAGARIERVATAKQLIETQFSWSAVVDRWVAFLLQRHRRRPGIKVAMVTTWNSRCGIAEYSRSLVEGLGGFADVEPYADHGVMVLDPLVEESTFRAWRQDLDSTPDELRRALRDSTADIVHIQYNFGFFSARELGRLIEDESGSRPVIVTLHRTADLQIPDRLLTLRDAAGALRRAAQVIVHQHDDVEFLAEIGVASNVTLIPIGCQAPCELDMVEMRKQHDVDRRAKVIGTFGFLLPHKGTIELIRSLPGLRASLGDVRIIAVNALHPDPSSEAYRARCSAEISRLGLEPFVALKTEYLPEATAHELLSACDVVVLPYGETRESSSATLRSVLTVGRPTIVTDVPIFSDARGAVAHLPSPVQVSDLVTTIGDILDDPRRCRELAEAARQFCVTHSWAATVARLRTVYEIVCEK